jgi:DNA-directed RNA polymerase subunit RPC12/RpoP
MITSTAVIGTRISTCLACEKTKDMSDNLLYVFVDAFGKKDDSATKLMCTECSCPIWVKARVPVNSCPLNKWSE